MDNSAIRIPHDDIQTIDRFVTHVLKRRAAPRYPFKLVSSRTEHDEVETVVRFIMDLRKVKRISMIGWSTGTPRAGGFAAMHPEKVDKLVLYGPAPYFPADTPPHPSPVVEKVVPLTRTPKTHKAFRLPIQQSPEQPVASKPDSSHPNAKSLTHRAGIFQPDDRT